MKNKNNDDDIEETNSKFKCVEEIISNKKILFYLNDDVSDSKDYVDLLHKLNTANPATEIIIHINNFGGYVHTAIQLFNSIKNSDAIVTTFLEGVACSAASVIFLAGDKIKVHPTCTLMIHSPSGWEGGKLHEKILAIEYDKEYYKKVFNRIYGNFLTKKEIKESLNGKDFWFESDEIKKRLKNGK